MSSIVRPVVVSDVTLGKSQADKFNMYCEIR